MEEREWLEMLGTPEGDRLLDRLYDIYHAVAVRLWEEAGKATMDFMLAHFPDARSIRRDYANGQHTRTIEAGGKTYAVVYDFKTKTTRWEGLAEEINKGAEEGLKQIAAIREARKKKAVSPGAMI